jgi:hypothetical protein
MGRVAFALPLVRGRIIGWEKEIERSDPSEFAGSLLSLR